jgi:hypothetical protein
MKRVGLRGVKKLLKLSFLSSPLFSCTQFQIQIQMTRDEENTFEHFTLPNATQSPSEETHNKDFHYSFLVAF